MTSNVGRMDAMAMKSPVVRIIGIIKEPNTETLNIQKKIFLMAFKMKEPFVIAMHEKNFKTPVEASIEAPRNTVHLTLSMSWERKVSASLESW